MNQEAPDRRRVVTRVGALFALMAALVAAVFGLSTLRSISSTALNPNDAMSTWQTATDAEKRATAEVIIRELQGNKVLGPRSQMSLKRDGGMQRFTDELVLALDQAADRNQATYVSPADPISRTAAMSAVKLGWNL